MTIRDRIKELRRVPASQLRPNPRNWRLHPENQQAALRGLLNEIGYADALLARELPDGTLELIDGHLRAAETPDEVVPVLVLDVNQQEADVILATHDPLAGMAETDREQLDALLGELQAEDAAVQAMLEGLSNREKSGTGSSREVEVPEAYQVVVECGGESVQREVYERLTSEGFRCRLLMI
jgi:hypothetical protein